MSWREKQHVLSSLLLLLLQATDWLHGLKNKYPVCLLVIQFWRNLSSCFSLLSLKYLIHFCLLQERIGTTNFWCLRFWHSMVLRSILFLMCCKQRLKQLFLLPLNEVDLLCKSQFSTIICIFWLFTSIIFVQSC